MTIHKNVKFTLDGKTKFTVGDETFQWNNDRWIDLVNIWSDDNKTYTNTVTLKNGDWGMSTMRFVGNAHMKVVIKDADSQDGRHIDYLGLGNAGGLVTLKSTEVGFMRGSDAADVITAGSGRIDNIYTVGGNDVIKGGSGSIGAIDTGRGNDRVTAGAGGIDQIAMGDGNNTFVGGNGWVGALRGGNGNDTVTVKNGTVETINLSHGENIINLTGSGWVASVITYDDNDVLKITGSSQVGSVNLGSGNNTIKTGESWVGSIITYGGNDNVSIGAGGTELVTMGHGNNTLTATGWVGAILAYSGNDVVTLGAGGAGYVGLGGGDDILHVSEVADGDGNSSVMLDGGNGDHDTVDFGSFKIAVQISLSVPYEYVTDTVYFVVTGFENLITGKGADEVIGNSADNVLTGGKGADSLTGNAGADTFVFASGDGTDTIEDFNASENDIIDLSAVTQIASYSSLITSHMQQVGSDVVIDDGAGDTITLADVAIADLTAGHFVFG